MSEILCKLSEKVELSNQHQLRFSEFGTRRRFSIDVQETVIKRLNDTAKVLYRNFQLLLCHEVRHENDGNSSA